MNGSNNLRYTSTTQADKYTLLSKEGHERQGLARKGHHIAILIESSQPLYDTPVHHG